MNGPRWELPGQGTAVPWRAHRTGGQTQPAVLVFRLPLSGHCGGRCGRTRMLLTFWDLMVNCRRNGTMQGVCPFRRRRGCATQQNWCGAWDGGWCPWPAFDDSSSSARHGCRKEDLRHMLSCGCSRYGLLHVTKKYAQVTMVPSSQIVDVTRASVSYFTLQDKYQRMSLVFPNRNRSRIYKGFRSVPALTTKAARKHTYEPPEVKHLSNCPHIETI